jgi:hypothetical protein
VEGNPQRRDVMEDRESTGSRRPDAMVTDIWTFRTEPSLTGAELVGFSIEATDGGIGKIDEGTEEMGRTHLIVDTGPWIFGKKVMIPAGVVDRVDLDTETVFVRCSKEQIKSAPEFVPETSRDDEEYRDRLGGYYSGL